MNVRAILKLSTVVLGCGLIFMVSSAQAQTEFGEEVRRNPYTGEPEQQFVEGYKPVTNMDILGGAHSSGESLLFQAEYAMHYGNYQGALHVIEQALKKDDDNADLHAIYAQALEQKYKSGEKRDPALFNKLVKEWLIVMRDEKGDEKGLYNHGFTTPLGKSMGDEDHSILAATHLYKLTGSVPRNGQSDKNYLKKVLHPSSASVTGKILKRPTFEE
jgi:hypothetical protein